ncbi:hypothetical protein BD311DRAFT_812740 [Dichomitus squalens]|uniref:Uncharacterized protein n=1 Tax=Dichomitus squalens TaxID=114155 RepID=A0A4Q9M2W1_9APHY|nr:hypothetical protein BD311DRAFT_812740 [Dichomitus squalens]
MAMLSALKCRCGIEAFKWDVEVIGSQLEAFAIAGCEIFTFLRTNRDRADWLKNEIREKMNSLYAEAIGQKGAVMQYKNYEQSVVIDHSVALKGWTHDVFSNPARLPAAIDPLRTLLNALDNGNCHFVRLTHAERAQHRLEHTQRIEAGTAKARKSRSDKGKKRGTYRRRSNSEKENEGPSSKRRRVEPADNVYLSDSGSESSADLD